jgi:NADH-quinone oxidoreductase subunit J
MLTNQKDEVKKTYSILQIIFVLLFVITIVLLIAKDLVSNLNISAKNVKTESNFNAVETLGIRLLSTEVLPFELSAVLLLVSLLGAAFIATKKYLK